MVKFEGLIPAIITPFNENGSIFMEGLENELNYLYDFGYRNVFVCGSYGSFPVMNIDQRKKVASYVAKCCINLRMKTIIQIGSTSTNDAIELAQHAEFVGANAISSVVPFYYSNTIYKEEDFLRYYEEIIKNVITVDVHCYNNPNTTGFNVSPEFLKKLMDIGVRGIKDGGSDMGRMLEMLNVFRENKYDFFDYYPSSTSSIITGLLLGVRSCVSGVCLTYPKLVMDIYNSMINGNIPLAIKLYQVVMKIRSILGAKGGRPVTAYDVLNARGVDVGTCKAPWQRLSKDNSNWVLKELEQFKEYE